ncbi:antitoxin VapB family protein [Haloglomus litoreum]|uniref:antitoxin VapB family protein n=1 Tax=Haloglomus litoreum TaxID=3034026 RepID=UPI0023E86714|nr:antitoxin VapB family protein [Haloglomus sp. DT116]
MGTKTIGLREDAYERLKARKRDDESFTDLVNRLLDESTADWREGFGTLPSDEATDLEQFAKESREGLGAGLADRQSRAVTALREVESDDEESS